MLQVFLILAFTSGRILVLFGKLPYTVAFRLSFDLQINTQLALNTVIPPEVFEDFFSPDRNHAVPFFPLP